ncbi:pumilio/PUF RNA binding protein 4 [Trypanosoma rangeli SC58]|uniref:Pumilio/PUF RNA binding protein 4 n=1 Tax=Trypanosoma rangeli SC58 TaxID=429131 RepID=A0A061J741_TRYRA|nr:pumilio/PUF RNA binding protein 4 [Trypanosoma rangeli SC58]
MLWSVPSLHKRPDNHTAAATIAVSTNAPTNHKNNNNKRNSNRNTAENSGRGSDYSWMPPEEGWGSPKSSSPPTPLRDMTRFLEPKSDTAPGTRHPPQKHSQQQQGAPLVPLLPSGSGESNRPSLASSERQRSSMADGPAEPHRDAVFPRVPFQPSVHRGHVMEMASDQHGCRELQSVLERFPYHSREVQCIVSELLPGLPKVMANPYGNFLAQKLLEIAPDEDRLRMLSQHLSSSLSEVAISPHGNYAVQKLIDSLRSRQEVEVVCAALRRGVMMLVNDLNGGHVVQKLLQCLPHDVVFVYDIIVEMTLAICNDKQGCCVVQKCMDSALPEQLPRLQEAVLRHVLELSTNPYGNYVVTHLIRQCSSRNQHHVVDRVAACVGPALKALCTNKFASNVVETILHFCSEAVNVQLCRFLLQEPNEKTPLMFSIAASHDHQHTSATSSLSAMSQQMPHQVSSTLSIVALNQFGNYVVQKMLAVLPVCTELIHLIYRLHQLLPMLLEMNFGKRVEAKMEQAKIRITQHYEQKGITAGGLRNCTTAVRQTGTTMAHPHSTHVAAEAALQWSQQQRRHHHEAAPPVAPAVTVVARAPAALPASCNSDNRDVGYHTNSGALFAVSPMLRGTPQQQPVNFHQQPRQSHHRHGTCSRRRREQRSKAERGL